MLKRIRQSKGLKQKTLANMLGVKQTTLSMWETGKSRPREIELIKKLAETLNVTTDEILECFS